MNRRHLSLSDVNGCEWAQVQECGSCGQPGAFFLASLDYGFGPVCAKCEHVFRLENGMLDELEEFAYIDDHLHLIKWPAPVVNERNSSLTSSRNPEACDA